jgi:hypothetical protein
VLVAFALLSGVTQLLELGQYIELFKNECRALELLIESVVSQLPNIAFEALKALPTNVQGV